MKQTHNHGFNKSNKMLTQTSNKEKEKKKLQTHNHWSKPITTVSINHIKCLPKHQTTKKKKQKNKTKKHCVTVTRRRGWLSLERWNCAWGDQASESFFLEYWNGDALLYWSEEMKWREESDMTEEPLERVWKGAHHVICSNCGTG